MALMGATGANREFILKIIADVKDATKGINDVEKSTQSFKDKAIGWGKSIATGLAVAAVADFARQSVNAAMDLDDAMDGVATVFGTASESVNKFGEQAAETMGLSQAAYGSLATRAGGMLRELGVPTEQLADQTNNLMQRAADVAVTYGTDASQAVEAFTQAMAGQTRGLKQYNIVIDKTEVDTRAAALGYVDAAGDVTDAGRAIATQQLIMEKTANSAGMFEKNAGDLGSQAQIVGAKFENLKATLGTQLLPVLERLMEIFAPLLDFLAQNSGWLVPLAGIIAGIVVAIKAWTVAQAAFNVVMMANPIGLVVAAIAALVAAVVVAYQKVDWFRELVDSSWQAIQKAWDGILNGAKAVFGWIRDNWPLLLAILTGPFGAVVALIVKNWDTIKQTAAGVIDWFRTNWNRLFDVLVYPFTHLVDALKWLFGGLADMLTYPFRVAFDGIKWLWNHTVGGFGFTVPSWIPLVGGKEFRIPRMATGGIVTRPTLAIIGEAGPEAVVPLNGRNTPGMGDTYVINVYALNASADTGRLIAESLREYNRTAGSLGVGTA